MPIRSLEANEVAHARLNALRFTVPVTEAAQMLARWQVGQGSLLVPIPIALPKQTENSPKGASFFRDRARLVRIQIAKALGLEGDAALKLSFTMSDNNAWYLGPRPKLDKQSMLAAVANSSEKFIELMLLKELMESAAIDAQDTFVGGGFGPSVYLGSVCQASSKYLQLSEVEYKIHTKHGLLLCDVTAKRFARKTTAEPETSSTTRLASTGQGFLVGVTRLVPDEFFKLDGRQKPMEGLSLDIDKVWRTRLYYLNLLTEFAIRLFTQAGIPFVRETFAATHCVDNAYIALEPLANLQQPLTIVNTTGEPLDQDSLAPLVRFPEYLPGYHVAGGKKTHFPAPEVQVAKALPDQLQPTMNYLFLNGRGDENFGSVRLAKTPSTDLQPAEKIAAYTALAKGEGQADPYTEVKYHHLLAQKTFVVATQGLDYGPRDLARLRPGKADNTEERQLQESLKRCFVELSVKEVLLGRKSVPVSLPAMPYATSANLTLLATRRSKLPGRTSPAQTIAAVDVCIDGDGIAVTRVRRTPWGHSEAVLDLVFEYDFLQEQEQGKTVVRNGQFWVVDQATNERLRVWAGRFVPKIILNDTYEGIEHAIAVQDDYLTQRREGGSKGRFLSKGREFNLLPYYISMFKPEYSKRGECVGSRMPVQDCGAFVRVFVPPAGGISGSGDALSGMRDVMHYSGNGISTIAGLLDLPLMQLYLHTMTNGVLVGGDNSKMSLLEKLTRLALEN